MTRQLVAAAARAAAARDPLIDALRACALLGVLIVNALSYPGSPAGSPLGLPMPTDSTPAIVTLGLVAWLLQGKAYPLLAFLVGYSLSFALRQASGADRAYRARRVMRMLMLGALHGALLYAGDILTMYALASLLLLTWTKLPLRGLLARWRCFAVLAVAMLAFSVALSLDPLVLSVEPASGLTYGTVHDVPGFLALNSASYFHALPAGVLLFLPEVLMLMTGGFIAGRLRWLTHRRWQAARCTLGRRWLVPALGLNLLYAVLVTLAARHNSPWQWVWLSAGPLAGWLLSAAACLSLAAWWHARRPLLLRTVAPLGRYTLTVYVGHSLLCALVFSGAGWGWPAGSVGLVLWAAGAWACCVLLAIWARRRGFHGPLEAWMIRA